MRYFNSLLVVSLSLVVIGCRPQARDEATANVDDEIGSSVVAGEVYLDAAAKEAIGLLIEGLGQIPLAEVVVLTGWLVSKPGSENVIQSPATGFYRHDKNGVPKIGQQLTNSAELGAIRVVFTPQERAQLVIAKEEAEGRSLGFGRCKRQIVAEFSRRCTLSRFVGHVWQCVGLCRNE